MLALVRTIESRDKLLHVMELRDNLMQQLSQATDWDEFCQRLLEFPRSLTEVKSDFLMVFNEQEQRFLLAASQPAVLPGSAQAQVLQNKCNQCMQSFIESNGLVNTCNLFQDAGSSASYCLVLRYANKVTGVLNFCTEGNQTVSTETRQTLESVSVIIAPVLEAFKQKRERVAVEIAEATRSERLAIAQEMHDTIGQNLCYLRLKLDHFSSPEGLRSSHDTRQEMEQMRDTANESYELVRGALAILHLENSPQFIELLHAHSSMVADRAGFQFTLENIGEPKTLAPEIMRHAFYVCREALANIEHHAQAKNALIRFTWKDDGLNVTVLDDGIGFNPDRVLPDDHYGLSIMKNRIESVNGQFCVLSTVSHGTQVNFWVPYIKEAQPLGEVTA